MSGEKQKRKRKGKRVSVSGKEKEREKKKEKKEKGVPEGAPGEGDRRCRPVSSEVEENPKLSKGIDHPPTGVLGIQVADAVGCFSFSLSLSRKRLEEHTDIIEGIAGSANSRGSTNCRASAMRPGGKAKSYCHGSVPGSADFRGSVHPRPAKPSPPLFPWPSPPRLPPLHFPMVDAETRHLSQPKNRNSQTKKTKF